MRRDDLIPGTTAALPDVRGHMAMNRPASALLRALAWSVDISLGLMTFCFVLEIFGAAPSPRKWWILAVAAMSVIAREMARHFFGRSLGEAVWKLKVEGGSIWTFWSRPVFQYDKPPSKAVASAMILTGLAVAGSSYVVYETIWSHPLWLSADQWTESAYLPDLAGTKLSPATQSGTQWTITPFYYSMGAWPVRFEGEPVFYGLPYQKGPPARFAGHIIARWRMPDTFLTFEGPKTPRAFPREEIRKCLLEPYSVACFRVRQSTLMRHIQEMEEALSPRTWSLRWLQVENLALTPDERAQGIFLSANGSKGGQDRFILITPEGTHQAFILSYGRGYGSGAVQVETAREIFLKSIRSLRSSDTLYPGRAWVDQHLSVTKLAELDSKQDAAEFVSRLSTVQSLLVAKVSVDPKTFDTYYHLGGVGIMLARHATRNSQDLRRLEWSAVAKPLIQSAYLYAKDIAPNEPRVLRLQEFWAEVQKAEVRAESHSSSGEKSRSPETP